MLENLSQGGMKPICNNRSVTMMRSLIMRRDVWRSKMSITIAAGIVISSLGSLSHAADDDGRAYMLASSCTACHGPEGKSPDAIPSLHGKSESFISAALKGFRDGSKPATMMNRLAKGYSDEEIAIIAAWFAAQ
jgi:sulfide dehydrogenase cytochrome subunit